MIDDMIFHIQYTIYNIPIIYNIIRSQTNVVFNTYLTSYYIGKLT